MTTRRLPENDVVLMVFFLLEVKRAMHVWSSLYSPVAVAVASRPLWLRDLKGPKFIQIKANPV